MYQGNGMNERPQTAQTSPMRKASNAKLSGRPSKVSIAQEPSKQPQKQSRVSYAAMDSKVSIAPSRSSVGLRSSFMLARTSRVHPSTDFEALVLKMGQAEQGTPTSTDFKSLTDYFMGCWKAPHAAAALNHLERLETKRTVRKLQKLHGFWQPPPEVSEALRKNPTLPTTSLPNTIDTRNLRFVLKILGCSLRENQPYKQFLRAKSLRQKRHWLYKYQGPKYKPNPSYAEPICPTRLKRLYHFFPDRFTEKGGIMHFNDKILSYDEKRNVFYVGKELEEW